MIKRTPQEIADFFQCYVAQNRDGSWHMFFGRPYSTTIHWCLYDSTEGSMEIDACAVDVPTNHLWTMLYEPRMQKPEKPDHASEVFIHKEYVVVEGNRIQDLSKKVNTLLNHGWKLQGGVAVEYLPESDGYKEGSEVFYQAMVRGV